MTTWSQINFQVANSPTMEQLLFFHDSTMILTMITMTVMRMMMKMAMNKKSINS